MTSALVKELPGDDLRVVATARELVVSALLGLPQAVVDDARTVASELVANACKYTRCGRPGGVVRVRLEVAAADVTVCVADQGRDDEQGPVVCPPDRDEGGMGLQLCAALGSLWFEGDRHGRRACVRLPIPVTARPVRGGASE